MIGVRTASGLKDIASVYVRTASGLKEIGEVWVRTASGLKQVFGSFSLSASAETVYGSSSSHGSIRINTSSVTITPTPAGAVTSVAWSGPAGWDALSPSSLTTSFRSPVIGPSDGSDATFTCTVMRGGSTATIDVGASVTNFGF
jgi:hypothetical protein